MEVFKISNIILKNNENIKFKIFPALYGDCFLISIKEENSVKNILIDGGLTATYRGYLVKELKEISIKNQKLDLIINTHIDSDHIRGLISFLEENNNKKIIEIGEIWFNGLDQIMKKYPIKKGEEEEIDSEILETILKKGYEDEFLKEEEISSKEGISLSGLIEFGKYNHNTVSNGHAISSELSDIKLSDEIKLKILNPNIKKLQKLENEWLEELNKMNFHYSVPKSQKLISSFEFIISRMKNKYQNSGINISTEDNLEDYLSNLDKVDTSVVNDSSISFVLEVYNKKFLFLGDVVIKKNDECNILQRLTEEYRKDRTFDLIKMPHHGSSYNISKDFINLFDSLEYIFSTNSKYGLPDIEVLANLVCKSGEKNKVLIFNYPIKQAEFINKKEWMKKYNYNLIIGNGNEIIERSY